MAGISESAGDDDAARKSIAFHSQSSAVPEHKESPAESPLNHVGIAPTFNQKAQEALLNLGRDFAVSAALNTGLIMAFDFPNMLSSLGEAFRHEAMAIPITAVSITAGRYVGGAAGMAVDALAHNKEGKYRHILATTGGAVAGGFGFFISNMAHC